jgi:hypothetical protein
MWLIVAWTLPSCDVETWKAAWHKRRTQNTRPCLCKFLMWHYKHLICCGCTGDCQLLLLAWVLWTRWFLLYVHFEVLIWWKRLQANRIPFDTDEGYKLLQWVNVHCCKSDWAKYTVVSSETRNVVQLVVVTTDVDTEKWTASECYGSGQWGIVVCDTGMVSSFSLLII